MVFSDLVVDRCHLGGAQTGEVVMPFFIAPFLLIAGVMLASIPAIAQDVAGSSDHPLIGRFEGSVITAYEALAFDEVAVALRPEEVMMVEGAVARLAYTYPEGTALVQVVRNFEQQLNNEGFSIKLSCSQEECGGMSYEVEQFGNSPSWADRFNYRYVMGTRVRADGTVHATFFGSVNNGIVRGVITVTEEEVMAFEMVAAEEMQSAISETGRVALYGIQFALDDATIQPESTPTLEEIARFLSANQSLLVVIVGHTDNQGALPYNLDLSARRAQAVRDALVEDYNISADRLSHAGAGFLAPVASNASEGGRALNRRVEIIAR
ncbi:MAG: OmpA family protein [Hyphomicrobiales bacterium]|jgi:OOP family OmpA-OmpF porin